MNPGRCLILIKGHHTQGSRCPDVFRDYIAYECVLALYFITRNVFFPQKKACFVGITIFDLSIIKSYQQHLSYFKDEKTDSETFHDLIKVINDLEPSYTLAVSFLLRLMDGIN